MSRENGKNEKIMDIRLRNKAEQTRTNWRCWDFLKNKIIIFHGCLWMACGMQFAVLRNFLNKFFKLSKFGIFFENIKNKKFKFFEKKIYEIFENKTFKSKISGKKIEIWTLKLKNLKLRLFCKKIKKKFKFRNKK